MAMIDYDFCGYATRANIKCADGRTILEDAFKDDDGIKVPLVWNHRHDEVVNVLGHALLENRKDGVYAYGKFSDTPDATIAKTLVKDGVINSMSIYANQLQHDGSNVTHGKIREVSLVLAGANPGAVIESVICHSDGSPEEAEIYTEETLELFHAEEPEKKDEPEDTQKEEPKKEKTVADVYKEMTPEQQKCCNYMVAQALGDDEDEEPEPKENEGDESMKQNAFDQYKDTEKKGTVLCHSDQASILELAKSSRVGSFQEALSMYVDDHKDTLTHGIADEDFDQLFPDFQDVTGKPGAKIERDQGWVGKVIAGTHKTPISRIRTRQVDLRGDDLRAFGYKKGAKKNLTGNIKLMKRTTDPTTIYVKDKLERDDIVDITEFDVVNYLYEIMKQNLNEELATAIMLGDGREDGDENKIDESKIRPIWKDDELYTLHTDVDLAAAKAELQGTNTSANFGENYIYAEAIITASLYSREKYKGSGNLTFYCTPHSVNQMLLARDLNGRRIYSNISDLTSALNVSEIQTAEQFEGKIRTTSDGKKKKLIGIFVNLADYYVGSTKGGEITRFNQFDIDFNQEKYLIETRVSGALAKVYSAIVLEEDVTDSETV